MRTIGVLLALLFFNGLAPAQTNTTESPASAIERYLRTGSPRHLDEAFVCAEKNKSPLLYKGIREKVAPARGGSPDDYGHPASDLHTAGVAAIQRDLLSPDMALVEYVVGDNAVYIFTIRKQDVSVHKLPTDFPLGEWVDRMRRGLTAFHTDPGMGLQYELLAGLYTETAFHLYEKLVAPIAAQLPARVVIIPDGVLGYVPFEALLVERPRNPTQWTQHHYLLNEHDISYCYSAAVLREMLYRTQRQPTALPLLGFAPYYAGNNALPAASHPYTDDPRKDFGPLPHTGEEVHHLARLMQGRALTGTAASKTTFLEKAGQARILHLATHGHANPHSGDSSYLVFAGPQNNANAEILYARDICNLQLNAELVTLSACETGFGELQSGEGVVSLARAFACAGARSVVTALWCVSDGKTKDLMIDFYRNLSIGLPKDRALRQAKLDFLKRNKGQAAHPFYWAGFVGIGGMGKMK